MIIRSRRKEPTGVCAKCHARCNPDKMGLCPTCRIRLHSRCKFHWTPEMDAKLRRIYQASETKLKLTASITRLEKEFKFPRCIITNRSVKLGLQVVQHRDWTPAEIHFLENNAGALTVKKIARMLKRSDSSVKNFIFRMGFSGQMKEGYSQKGLAQLIGVSHYQVAAWIRRGLLELSEDIADRVTHESVRKFLLFHMNEYSLRRVEEWWMKMLVTEELEVRARTRPVKRRPEDFYDKDRVA